MQVIGYIHQGSEFMPVFEGGYIAREAGKVPGGGRPSGKWRLMGAVQRNNFGRVVKVYSQEEVLAGGITWYHKNGKQKVFLADMDHGTYRELGSGVFLPATARRQPEPAAGASQPAWLQEANRLARLADEKAEERASQAG